MTCMAERALVARFLAARRDPELVVLEGLHALKHALRFGAGIVLACAADRSRLRELAQDLCPDVLERLDVLVEPVPSAVFKELSPRPPETCVIALAQRPRADLARLFKQRRSAPVVLLENPSHLGNVGAVIRVAAAAGAAAVLTTGVQDPWHPAAVRGSAGLHFAQPVARIDRVPADAGPLLAIDPDGQPLDPAALPADAILAFGSERQGLSAAMLGRADGRLAISMARQVSSLNLATAAAVVLYAWRMKPGME